MINYEAEVQEILIEAFKKRYGVMQCSFAFKIFLLRFYTETLDKKFAFEYRELCEFLIKELQLPTANGNLVYKEQLLVKYHSTSNSLANILDDWFYVYGEYTVEDNRGNLKEKISVIKLEFDGLLKRARKEVKVKRKDDTYFLHLKHILFEKIKHDYGLNIREGEVLLGFTYGENHNLHQRTIDETYCSLVHADILEKRIIEKISEVELERYLMNRLHLVEEGMIYIGHQVEVESGRLDILAKDKSNTICIIELKIEDDERVVFQSIYYPMEIKRKYKVDKVRMIVVGPKLSTTIIKSLKVIGEIEIYEFTPIIKNKRLESLSLERIS